jgi:magnesium-transporting ATPase (P-type)
MNFVKFVKLFMYKSMIYSLPLLFYNSQNGFSGDLMCKDLLDAMYDVVATVLAIIIFVLFDQDVSFKWGMKPGNEDKLSFRLSKYYGFCRDNVIKTLIRDYSAWFICIFGASALMYFIP